MMLLNQSHSSLMLQCTSHRATITYFGYHVYNNITCMPFWSICGHMRVVPRQDTIACHEWVVYSTRNHINSSNSHNITRQATVLALTYLGPSGVCDCENELERVSSLNRKGPFLLETMYNMHDILYHQP